MPRELHWYTSNTFGSSGHEDRQSTRPGRLTVYSGDSKSEGCPRSIDHRTGCNEWLVRNYRPIAIFVFGPIRVSQPIADNYTNDVEIDRDAAFALSPEYRIFSARKGRSLEYNREHRRWSPVSYTTIMTAAPITTA